jgi:hypothetical protein
MLKISETFNRTAGDVPRKEQRARRPMNLLKAVCALLVLMTSSYSAVLASAAETGKVLVILSSIIRGPRHQEGLHEQCYQGRTGRLQAHRSSRVSSRRAGRANPGPRRSSPQSLNGIFCGNWQALPIDTTALKQAGLNGTLNRTVIETPD